MSDGFYIGAYWGPRAETVETCASRLSAFLSSVPAIDASLADWFRTSRRRGVARRKPVKPSTTELTAALLAGGPRLGDSEGSELSKLGFALSLWNGREPGIGLNLRCGSSASVPGLVSNNVVVSVPSDDGDGSGRLSRASRIELARALVQVWEPSWCTWTTDALRNAQSQLGGGVVFGSATYLADSHRVDLARIPSAFSVERWGSGVALVSNEARGQLQAADIVELRGALTGTGVVDE